VAKSYQHYHKQPKNIKQLLEKMSPAEREIYELKNQIDALKALPVDFRDIPEGSTMWDTYYRYRPEKRLEMTRYKRGVWLHIQELSEAEITYFGEQFSSYVALFNEAFVDSNIDFVAREFNWGWEYLQHYIDCCIALYVRQERFALQAAKRESWDEWDLKEKPELFEVPMIKGLYIKGPDSRMQCDTFNQLATIVRLPIRFKREYTDEKGRAIGVTY
jgi:hypothetical protein